MSNQELRPQFVRAVESGDVEAARGIWNRNRGVVESVIPLDRYIEVAAERDDVPMMEALVGFGARIDPNISDENEPEGPIFTASSEGAVNAVRWLLDRGATINHVVKGQRRCLSLTTAAIGGHLDVVKLLVEHGADLDAVWMGQNALSAAMTYGRSGVADYLRSKGALMPAELETKSTAEAPSRYELLLQHITEHIGTPQPLSLQEIIPSDPRVTIH
ncbi:MAG: ankyrin repeat domain-containing protein, partial [Planctomycetia bacterium]|nr:ankyrin repeat domain-containing protein [Planctomycetia bacterium]